MEVGSITFPSKYRKSIKFRRIRKKLKNPNGIIYCPYSICAKSMPVLRWNRKKGGRGFDLGGEKGANNRFRCEINSRYGPCYSVTTHDAIDKGYTRAVGKGRVIGELFNQTNIKSNGTRT